MPWFKVDDGFHSHPKTLRCSLAALGLWVKAGSWCAQQLQNGRVPEHVLPTLGGRPRDADELVAAGLWSRVSDGWLFHDWQDMQPMREQVEARRADDAERKRQARAAKTASAKRPGGLHADGGGRVRTASALPDPTRPDPTRSCTDDSLRSEVDVAPASAVPGPTSLRLLPEPTAAELAEVRAALAAAGWPETDGAAS